MELSIEDVKRIAEATAQEVVDNLHRYGPTYQEPKSVLQGIEASMTEEQTAINWYLRRAQHAEDNEDLETATRYREIAKDESHHWEQLSDRWQNVKGHIKGVITVS
jgi:rubrerythrin